mgnify:CR=1 FL=1
MKALFIGGTGTISTDVVALAQQRGWEITLLNRGSKKCRKEFTVSLRILMMKKLWQKPIALEHYDVVAQIHRYTAEDVKRDIRLFQIKRGNTSLSAVPLPIKSH